MNESLGIRGSVFAGTFFELFDRDVVTALRNPHGHASNWRNEDPASERVFEKSWFHQSIEHEAECDRVDYPRRLDSAVVILATVGTFQTPS